MRAPRWGRAAILFVGQERCIDSSDAIHYKATITVKSEFRFCPVVWSAGVAQG